jgi:hypothetical protein
VALGLHADEEFFCPVQVPALVGGVYQSVVGEVVGLGFLLLAHGVENQFGLLEFAVKVKHLQHSGVEDGIERDAFVFHHAFLDVFSTFHVLVFDASLEQCSIGKLVYFDLALRHVDIEYLHAFVEVTLVSMRFDQYSEGDLVRLNLLGKHSILYLQCLFNVILHDCHVHDEVE